MDLLFLDGIVQTFEALHAKQVHNTGVPMVKLVHFSGELRGFKDSLVDEEKVQAIKDNADIFMHILDAVILMHILDAELLMHILDAVIFMHILDALMFMHILDGVILMHRLDVVIFRHILEAVIGCSGCHNSTRGVKSRPQTRGLEGNCQRGSLSRSESLVGIGHRQPMKQFEQYDSCVLMLGI